MTQVQVLDLENTARLLGVGLLTAPVARQSPPDPYFVRAQPIQCAEISGGCGECQWFGALHLVGAQETLPCGAGQAGEVRALLHL